MERLNEQLNTDFERPTGVSFSGPGFAREKPKNLTNYQRISELRQEIREIPEEQRSGQEQDLIDWPALTFDLAVRDISGILPAKKLNLYLN